MILMNEKVTDADGDDTCEGREEERGEGDVDEEDEEEGERERGGE